LHVVYRSNLLYLFRGEITGRAAHGQARAFARYRVLVSVPEAARCRIGRQLRYTNGGSIH